MLDLSGWLEEEKSEFDRMLSSVSDLTVSLRNLGKKKRKMGYREKIKKKGGINNYSILAMVNVQRSTIVKESN